MSSKYFDGENLVPPLREVKGKGRNLCCTKGVMIGEECQITKKLSLASTIPPKILLRKVSRDLFPRVDGLQKSRFLQLLLPWVDDQKTRLLQLIKLCKTEVTT